MEVAADGAEIEHCGREIDDHAVMLAGNVADHRQRLEVNLRRHDGRSKAEYAAAFEPLECMGEDQKIAIAGVAIRRAVAVGMLVGNVVPDSGVDRGGNPETISPPHAT